METVAEKPGDTSHFYSQATDRSPGGQPAPAEDIAKRLSASEIVADREGFEPSERSHAHTLSKRAP